MNCKLLSAAIAGVFACNAYASDAPMGPPEGWSGLWVNNITFQKGSRDMQRGIHFNADGSPDFQIADSAGRMQNAFILQFKTGDWTFMGNYVDLRRIGGGAYSLTNPLSTGVQTWEDVGSDRKNVNSMSGIYELAATWQKGGTMVSAGKIDTSIYYLADPVFGGDLLHGADYGNAATRTVAPPFPSLAVVAKHDFGNGWSLTGIVGDAFGDRETLDAGKNLRNGDLAYVAEVNYQDDKQHYQLTFNHVDDFKHMDGDTKTDKYQPELGSNKKMPFFGDSFDAVFATASYRVNPNWAVFGRAGYAKGDDVTEDLNLLAGVRYDKDRWYTLVSQSATRVALDEFGSLAKKGDYTYVTEASLNYKLTPMTTVGLTYDMYNTSGNSLLAKDGGFNGNKRTHVVGLRLTSFVPF